MNSVKCDTKKIEFAKGSAVTSLGWRVKLQLSEVKEAEQLTHHLEGN